MKAFRVVLVLTGLFIVATGLLEIALGPAALPGDQTATPSADSNYRFFAAMWLAMGVVLLWRPMETVRVVSVAVFVGGLARIVSIAAVGSPHPMLLGLLGVELVAPPLLLLWHHRLTRQDHGP